MCGLIAQIEPSWMMKLCPSAGSDRSADTATAPLPPARFSTTTGWPAFSCRRRATMRATVSGSPPAPAGMMKRMPWLGYGVWPAAGAISAGAAIAASAISVARRWRRVIERSLLLRRHLRGQHPLGRFDVDQRIGIEVRGDDVRPLVQDPVERIVVLDVEDRSRAPPHARIDVPAHAARFIARDPRPERLPRLCQLRRLLRPRRRDDQKQHDGRSYAVCPDAWSAQIAVHAITPAAQAQMALTYQ